MQLSKEDWHSEGKYPIISQEQECISGYTDKEDGLITNVPLIAFGDHSLTIKYINFPFFYGEDALQFIKTNQICDLKIFYYILQNNTEKLKKIEDRLEKCKLELDAFKDKKDKVMDKYLLG